VKFRASGDISMLLALANRLESMSEHMDKVAAALAKEVVGSLIPGQFDRQEAPDGTKWAPTIRGGEILSDKGRMKAGWSDGGAAVHHDRNGFTVENPSEYAPYHQTGTGIYGPRGEPIRPKVAPYLRFAVGERHFACREVKGVPARPMVPDSGELPPSWDNSLRETAEETLAALLGGKL
jgi:hypothetical protein